MTICKSSRAGACYGIKPPQRAAVLDGAGHSVTTKASVAMECAALPQKISRLGRGSFTPRWSSSLRPTALQLQPRGLRHDPQFDLRTVPHPEQPAR